MNELQNLMDEIAEWSDATFGYGQRNPAIVYHLKKEVKELIKALKRSKKNEDYTVAVHKEYADCFMLILDSARVFGLNAELLIELTDIKLQINKNRKWGKPDKNGVVEHI